MLFGIMIFLFVIVCIFLCLLVLIQSDKGGGISSTLGGGFSGASNLLGAQDTANILTKATSISATLFMVLCIVISLVLSRNAVNMADKSVLKARAEKEGQYAPSSILNQPIEQNDQGGTPAGSSQLPVIPLDEGTAASQAAPAASTPAPAPATTPAPAEQRKK